MIICGDALVELEKLETGSVHLVVTSPPYDDLRSYGGHSWFFQGIALQLQRVLCDGGVICWNVGDSVVEGSETLNSFRQALFFQGIGLRVHDTMIWHKLNFSNPERVRYHQIFEYVFVFSKGAPRCFNPIKDKPNAQAGLVGTIGRNTYQKRDGSRETRSSYITQEFGMRGNVWTGNTSGQENMGKSLPHPAMMPGWLAQDLIISWSQSGDVVLDPFSGSGTTGIQAQKLGRQFILIDSNPDYVKLCESRTQIRTPDPQLL